MRIGDFGRAERALDEALAASIAAGDRRLELRTRIEREFLRSFTDPEGSALDDSRVADDTIPELEQLGDDRGLAKAWWLKAELHVNACRWGARAEALEKALEHAKRSGDAAEVGQITAALSQALYFGPTPVPKVIARCEEFLAESPENRALEASVTAVLAGLRAMEGDFDRARSLSSAAREIYEELGLRFRIVMIASILAAEIEQRAGRPDEAVSIIREAFGTLQEMGATSPMATMAAFLADALCLDGRLQEAADIASISEEHAPANDVATQIYWRTAKARALAATDPAAAEALARGALATARQTDHPDLKGRALRSLADVLGSSEEAASLRTEARRVYEQKGDVAAAAQS
jgi:ATP/maltotriose-dependent transcriptional regulator MalT